MPEDGGPQPDAGAIRIALCGDVMLGRGLDQILPHPGDPRLHEDYLKSALDYVALAVEANGPIPRSVDFAYPWGDAIAVLEGLAPDRRPDLRIVNLETALTRSGQAAPKGINYRMSPENLPTLSAFGIDCCVLANNHVLDWGEAGLEETLGSLERAGIPVAGAGRDAAAAAAPAILPVRGQGRVLVFAAAAPSSGVPQHWAARRARPGIALLPELSRREVERMAARIAAVRRPGDLVVVSLHWGPNWGYAVGQEERSFALGLIERAKVDLVHGHSSHHPKGVALYAGKPVLYGCGDVLNDYEGIGGQEDYRGDLVLLYLVSLVPPRWDCSRIAMLPFRLRKFRLQRATAEETSWLRDRLDRECRKLGGKVDLEDGHLRFWPA